MLSVVHRWGGSMKKTSIIKIVCVLVLLLGVHQCTSYKKLAPHIFLVKENTSFLNQTLTMDNL